MASVVLLTGCGEPPATSTSNEPVPVTVSVPIERVMVDYEEFTGHTEAVGSVEIRARVTGYLDEVCFKEGNEIKEGDLLFKIDPRPFQTKYDRELAQIEISKAKVALTKAELARGAELLPKKAISPSDYDKLAAEYQQAVGTLAADEATAKDAKLNLDFTKVHSPISGDISRTQITKGNLVIADQTFLTTIKTVDPIYVYFDADETMLLNLAKAFREGKIKVPEDKNQQAPFWMGLANEKGFPHQGKIDFAENSLNPKTGTLQIRGVIVNPKATHGDRMFGSGLFARIRLPIREPYKAMVVAERALGTDQSLKYVLVVNDQNKVDRRPVTVGKLEGRVRVIEKGLKSGERVIVTGMQRVKLDSTVAPKLVDMNIFLSEEGPEVKSEKPAAEGEKKPESDKKTDGEKK